MSYISLPESPHEAIDVTRPDIIVGKSRSPAQTSICENPNRVIIVILFLFITIVVVVVVMVVIMMMAAAGA